MNYTAGILIVALIALGGYIFPKSESATFFLGGDSTNFTELGTEEFKVGTDCDDGGTYDSCQGAAITKVVCSAATTWNPGTVASTTPALLDVTVTGLTLGDVVWASIATSTQGLAVAASASSTNLAAVQLFNPDGNLATIDIATTTVKVCAMGTS